MTIHEDEARATQLTRNFFSGHLSRRQLMKGAGAIGATAVLTQLLVACAPGGTTGTSTGGGGGSPVKGGTLTAALTGNPSSMDPAAAGIYTSLQVIDNIFSKLITMDEKGKFIPELATKWTQNDEKTYTFDLRSGVKFHNGEPFSATDVKYTFDRILDPATASTYATLYSSLESVEVASPTQVVFHLSEPFAPFLTNVAQNGEIMNKKAVESADPTRNPVGTGPFIFVEWVQSDHITLKKNPDYFMKSQPYVDKIEFRFLDVNKSRIEALQSGQLDWVDAVPLNELKALSVNSQYNYVTSKVAGIPDFIAFNCAKAPFNNKALRQAIAAAIDRKEILDIAYFGAGEEGLMEVPSGSTWFGGNPPYKSGPNLKVAKQKMKEAGYEKGLDVTFLSLPQYPELEKTGVVLKAQLAKIGINVTIEQLEVTVWFDRYAKGDFELTSAYWSGTIDPDTFYSSQLVSTSPNNYSKYENDDVDKLAQQAKTESDEGKRKALYEKIRAIVWEESPIVFAHYETINYLMAKTVHGSAITPVLELNLDKVWKEKS
ncbi:ABC transporter substrate-binding protein [soil metagenome]